MCFETEDPNRAKTWKQLDEELGMGFVAGSDTEEEDSDEPDVLIEPRTAVKDKFIKGRYIFITITTVLYKFIHKLIAWYVFYNY